MGQTRPRARDEGSGNASPSHGVGTHRILPTVGWRLDPGGTPPHPSLQAFAGARVLGDPAELGLLARFRRPPLHLQPLRTRVVGRSHLWRPQHEATTANSLWAQTPLHLTEIIPTLPALRAPHSPGTVTRTETPAPQCQVGAVPGRCGADAGPGAHAPATPRAPTESKRTESRGCLPPPLGTKGTCPAVGPPAGHPVGSGRPRQVRPPFWIPRQTRTSSGGRSPGPHSSQTRLHCRVIHVAKQCEPCSVRRAWGGHVAPRHSCPIPSARPPDASQITSICGNECPRPHPALHPGVQWILQMADSLADQTRAAEALGSRPLGPGPVPGPGAELRPGVLNSA